MAAATMVDTYKILRDTNEWINSLEIAVKTNRGERACREAAKKLIDLELVRVRLIDKRQYFFMDPLTKKQEKLPLIVDINETIRIKDKK